MCNQMQAPYFPEVTEYLNHRTMQNPIVPQFETIAVKTRKRLLFHAFYPHITLQGLFSRL